MKWKAPVIIEIAVELKINAYACACAEVKQARRFLTPADPARQPMLDAVVLGPTRIRLSHWNGSAR